MDSVRWYSPVKRLADAVIAGGALVALSPVLLLTATTVRLTSSGPVFYRHVRCGKAGRRFRMVKFRTMREDADKIGAAVTTAGDPRVTPVGRVLRKTKLDELPQLWNVLMGDMSLVGPRPQVAFLLRGHYPDPLRRVILSVPPGITGPTQVMCRHEEEMLAVQTDPDGFYKHTLLPRKIASDVEYVRRRNPVLDVRCVADTALACLHMSPRRRSAI